MKFHHVLKYDPGMYGANYFQPIPSCLLDCAPIRGLAFIRSILIGQHLKRLVLSDNMQCLTTLIVGQTANFL